MKNILGKPKADDPIREAVKEGAATAIKKRYPLMSKRRIRKAIDGLDKKLSNGKRKGLPLGNALSVILAPALLIIEL